MEIRPDRFKAVAGKTLGKIHRYAFMTSVPSTVLTCARFGFLRVLVRGMQRRYGGFPRAPVPQTVTFRLNKRIKVYLFLTGRDLTVSLRFPNITKSVRSALWRALT